MSKFFKLLLVFSLVFTQIPFTAFAEGDTSSENQVTSTEDKVTPDFAAGHRNAAYLNEKGELYYWGSFYKTQAEESSLPYPHDNVSIPTKVNGMQDINGIPNIKSLIHSPLSMNAGLIKKDGSVWIWGSNEMGQWGTGVKSNENIRIDDMKKVEGLEDVKMASIGQRSIALKEDGTVWTWGSPTNLETGTGVLDPRQAEQVFKNPFFGGGPLDNIVYVSAGDNFVSALDKDGQVWNWGSNVYGRLGTGMDSIGLGHGIISGQGYPVVATDKVKKIAVGYSQTLALKTDGSVWGWGENASNLLTGDQANGYIANPMPLNEALTDIIDISISRNHAMALKSDGSVITWGTNGDGELGHNNRTEDGRYLPTKVEGIPKMVAITAGPYVSYAHDEEGNIWAWGNNWHSQLGRGNKFENKDTDKIPQKVKGISALGFAILSGKNARELLESRDELKISPESFVSDPIDASSGALIVEKNLLNYSGVYPFDFGVSYNSLLTKKSLLGNGWSHPFETKLIKVNDNEIRIQWNENKHTSFSKESDTIFKPTSTNDQYVKLEVTPEGYYLHTKNQIRYHFLTDGKLKDAKYKESYTLNYEYDTEGKLSSVKQTMASSPSSTIIFSRGFNFVYNSNGLIDKITDDANRNVQFQYDVNNNLIGIIDAKGNRTTYTYNISSQILTGTDNEGIIFLENEYDTLGRVIKQYDSDRNITTLSYDEISRPNHIVTTVTNREGKSRKLVHDSKYNLIEVIDELGNVTSYKYDYKGNRTSELYANENETILVYDDRSNLIETKRVYDSLDFYMIFNEYNNITHVKYADYNWFDYSYNEKQELIKMKDFKDNITLYNYSNGYLVEKIEPNNKTTKYEYLNGVLTKTTDGEGNITTFKSDAVGRVVEQTDPNGNVTKFNYDNNSNLISTTNPLEKTLTNTYDSHNELLSSTDYKGILENYSYDKNGNLISSKRGEQVTGLSYDKGGRLIETTSPNQNVSSTTYDVVGRIIEEVNVEGIKTTYKYDNMGNITSKKIGESITTYEYDKVGNLLSETDAKGNKTTYKYNDLKQRIEIIDAKGNSTYFQYDFLGNLKSRTDALDRKISYNYDSNHNLIQMIDARWNSTFFEYDNNNRLVKTRNELGHTNQFSYDKNGNLVQTIDALGNVTTREYDSLNRLVKVTDALGHSRSTEYDELGNITALYDAKGNKISAIQYDQYNNPTVVTDALGNKVTNKYDNENNLIEILDELNRLNKQSHDKSGQVTSTVDANSVESKATYNEFGQTTSYTDPNNNQTGYLYDKLGQVLKETNATGNALLYEYDEVGNMTKYINGRSQETTYIYNSVGNVTKKMDTDGTIEYFYDENYNLVVVKETKGEQVREVKREYDKINRMTKYIDEFGNAIQYQYDAVGNITKIIYPAPTWKEVSYTYDKVGNMKTVTDWNGNVTTYSYDENNQLILTEKPDGSTETREYDIKGQLVKLVNTGSNGQIINSYTYEYDAAGNVIKENENVYGYDNLNRIISANGRKYSYDNAGNLLSAEKTDTETPEVQEFTYGADNQMATYGLDTTNHDKDGNLLNIPLNGKLVTGTYDIRNRLTAIGDTKYFYNAENKRTSIEENGEITRFIVSPHTALDQVLMETDSNGNPTAYYVYGKGLISKGNASGENSYYHYDRRGSTVALTNNSGEVTDSYTYDIYGEQLTKEGETPNRFLYNGRYGVQTDNNGLYYMRARYYNPEIKRFINRDVIQGSILESQTFNRYAYVNGNPISYIDPFGLSREEDSSLLVNVWNFIIGDDINTLADPNASALEKVWAGVSIASNFIPGAGPAFKGLKVLTKGSKALFKSAGKHTTRLWTETKAFLKSEEGSFTPFTFTPFPKKDILNWKGEKVKIPDGHLMSPRDPDFSVPPIFDEGPFTATQREEFLKGNSAGTKLSPHHRHQIPIADGGNMDELPGPGHPEGNIHTKGSPTRHPNRSIFNSTKDGKSLRQKEIEAHWKEKGGRLIEVNSDEWIDPGPQKS